MPNNPNLPGNPHLLPDPKQQQQMQQAADAQINTMIRGSIIRIYEHLAVQYALAKMAAEQDFEGEPEPGMTFELRPDELAKLADQAVFMGPFIYAHLGMIQSPVPETK